MFGERLKKVRIENGITQSQLAMKIGVSKTTISSWENNYNSPSIDALVRLCNELEVSDDYLCDTEYKSFIVVDDLPEEAIFSLQMLTNEMRYK